MKKLKLNAEDLGVVSFEVASAEEARGTVEGNSEGTQYCGYTLADYIWNRTWMKPVVV